MKSKKWLHPEKRTMNFVQDKSSASDKKKLAIVIVALVFLFAFLKFGIWDRWQVAWQAKRDYLELETQVELVEKAAEEYDDIYASYRQYDETLIPVEERDLMDRIDLIKTIERCLLDKADMSSFSINDKEIQITVVNTSLQKVSDIVQRFKEEDMDPVTVLNAWTEASSGLTSANIVMTMKTETDLLYEEMEGLTEEAEGLEGLTEEAGEDEISE